MFLIFLFVHPLVVLVVSVIFFSFNLLFLRAFLTCPVASYQIADEGIVFSKTSGLKYLYEQQCMQLLKWYDLRSFLSGLYLLLLVSSLASEHTTRKEFAKVKMRSLKHYLHPHHFICAYRSSVFTVFPSSQKNLDSLFSQMSENPRSLDENTRMQYEWLRLYSFGFSRNNPELSPIRLARTGLYWSRGQQSIICYSCRLVIDISVSDPLADHERRSPNCRHILGTDDRNVPISHDSSESQLSQRLSSLEVGRARNEFVAIPESSCTHQNSTQETARQAVPVPDTQSRSTEDRNIAVTSAEQQPSRTRNQEVLSSLGINFERPRYPVYAALTVRISSFQGWPPYVTQTPKALAVAGFFYAGYADYVRCFFCGGGLRNWEDGDDPWVEHARWFPRCAFLLQNRGQDFVILVQEQHQALNSTDLEQMEQFPREHANNPTQLLISQAVEMGFPKESILSALQRVTSQKGDVSSVTLQDVIDSILEHQQSQGEGASLRSNAPSKGGLGVTVTSNGPSQDHHGAETVRKAEVGREHGRVSPVTTHTTTTTSGASESKDSQTSAISLSEENQQLKRQMECKICLNAEANVALLPCGHLCCCVECAPAMRKCPICRKIVRGTVRTYPT